MDILKINDLELNDGISYALMHEGFVPRPATVRQRFSDSPFTAGQKYRKTLSKPENQELSFRVKVIGTSKADMDAKLHALYDEVVKDEGLITYLPDGRTVYEYWTAYGSPSGEVDSYFSHEFQTAEICILSWTMMALPGPYGDEAELAPVWCLGDDNSFEKNDGANLQFWDITTFVGGTWAKESGAGNFLHGVQSLRLTGAAAGELIVATEKTLIQVDELKHFDFHAFAKKLSGTGNVDYQLKCYEADGTPVGDNDGNLLADEDCSFEGGSVGNQTNLVNCTIVSDPSNGYPGGHAVKMTVTAAGATQSGLTVTALTSPGSQYTFAVKFKSTTGRQYRVALWDNIGGYVYGAPVVSNASYQTAIVTATFNAASTERIVTVHAYTDALAADVVHWDSLILKAGASATPPTDLGIVGVLIGDNPTAAFLDRLSISAAQGIIHPSTSGETVKFPTGTTQVKRRIQQLGIGSIAFDNLYFANSEYAPGYKIRPTMGLVIPGDDILGNLPADADLYFSHSYAQLCWAAQTIPDAGKALYGVTVLDATHAWAVGNSGYAYFYDGTAWVKQALPVGITRARGIWAADATHVWAIGWSPTAAYWKHVLFFNGVSWAVQYTVPDFQGFPAHMEAIHGLDSTRVWMTGRNEDTYLILTYYYDGADWAIVDGGTISAWPYCVYAQATNNVFVGGNNLEGNGLIRHWTAPPQAWHTDALPPGTKTIYAVHGFDATHIWAVGDLGEIIFFNGATWTKQASGVDTTLRGVYAFDATNVRAVGDNGTILFFNGSVWQRQASGTTEHLYGTDGFNASNVWAVGYNSTVRVNWMTVEVVPFTDIYVGQRDDYHADYSPVVQPTAGVRDYLYTRMDSDYYKLDAAATATARFLLAAHEGSHLLTIGITFSGATVYDKCTVRLLLQTPAGTDITGDYVEFEIDMGDPSTVWKEVAKLATRFDPVAVPSHFARSDAGAIYQVVRLKAHDSLGAVKLWLDHIALIPVDRYCEVKDFNRNSLIFSTRERKAVLSSLDSTLGQAQAWTATKKIGTPRFKMDPKGVNMAIAVVHNSADAHSVGHHGIPWNLIIRYRPRYYLTPGS